jgi:uncharacterized membrane protein (UPF0136 family)
MKTKRPAKLIATAEKNITIIRENAPVITLTGVAFGASYGHIAKLCGDYGPHGWVQYATAACVDLLCIIGAEERQRDKRIGRSRKWGFVSWPTLVLIAGILVTLAANIATAEPRIFGYCVAAWPAGALLLAVSVLERRTSHAAVPEAASTRAAARKQAAEAKASPAAVYQPAVAPAPAVPQPVLPPVPAAEPAASIAEPGERTFDVLLAEARAYRDELARTGERLSKEKLRLRLTVGSGKALELLRVLKDEDPQDEARDGSEAAV